MSLTLSLMLEPPLGLSSLRYSLIKDLVINLCAAHSAASRAIAPDTVVAQSGIDILVAPFGYASIATPLSTILEFVFKTAGEL
jgi:hypothetical protein